MSTDIPKIDILLYIALNEEFNYLFDELEAKLGNFYSTVEFDDIAIIIYCWEIFSPKCNKYFRLGVVPAGKMGIAHAASVTSAILSKAQIRDVVVLGIAGTISDDFQPGDVFIPDSVEEYLANSATETSGESWIFKTSGNNISTSRRLLINFQNFQKNNKNYHDIWSGECVSRFSQLIDEPIQKSMIINGLTIRKEINLFAGDDRKLASGPAVSKGKVFAEWLKDVDRKISAIEMESAGVYDAAQIRTPAPRVIAIRGISDYADERKEMVEKTAKNRFRILSTKNALSLLIHGIEAGLFKPDKTPQKEKSIISNTKTPKIDYSQQKKNNIERLKKKESENNFAQIQRQNRKIFFIGIFVFIVLISISIILGILLEQNSKNDSIKITEIAQYNLSYGPKQIKSLGDFQLSPYNYSSKGYQIINVGEIITATVGINNSGDVPVTINTLEVAVRGPKVCEIEDEWNDGNRGNLDFPKNTDILLKPGETYQYSESKSYSEPGIYFAEPTAYYSALGWCGIPSYERIYFFVIDPNNIMTPDLSCIKQ